MTDDNVNPDQIPSEPVPAGRQANGAPPPMAEEVRWDHEPTWPGGEYGNDNDLVADGTCDDEDNGRSTPQLAAPRNPVANLPSMENARSRLSPALVVAILPPKR